MSNKKHVIFSVDEKTAEIFKVSCWANKVSMTKCIQEMMDKYNEENAERVASFDNGEK